MVNMIQTCQRLGEVESSATAPPRDVGEALRALSDDDLLRLQVLARLRARSLPSGVAWSDLLHEAVLRALAGTRPWPSGVPLLAFLAGIMRSLCSEQWRLRVRQETFADRSSPDTTEARDPERVYAAVEALTAIDRLFASDILALKVIAGLTNGLTAEDIRCHYGLSPMEYDTVRRRMRRTMLRHGLAWIWP
jgi:RNA polymerase sigma-70 factor (ECF subfamily)